MHTKIEVRNLPARCYFGIRRVVKHDGIGPACAEILPRAAAWLAERGVAIDGPAVTVYHSVNSETGDFDVQPGFFVSEAVEASGEFTSGKTAGGDTLFTTHVGPYTSLGGTWDAIFAHAASLNRTVSASSWEAYVDAPDQVQPDKLRTEIFVPLDEVEPATNRQG